MYIRVHTELNYSIKDILPVRGNSLGWYSCTSSHWWDRQHSFHWQICEHRPCSDLSTLVIRRKSAPLRRGTESLQKSEPLRATRGTSWYWYSWRGPGTSGHELWWWIQRGRSIRPPWVGVWLYQWKRTSSSLVCPWFQHLSLRSWHHW